MSEKQKKLIEHLERLGTEKPNPKSLNLDRLTAVEICSIINDEDQTIAAVVERSLPQIAKTSELVAAALKNNGRLFYIGAGTSGRLGVLDAAECPPTFGIDSKQVIGVIAGGHDTLVRSEEGVEDRHENAALDLQKFDFCDNDILIGLAASVKTPYTIAGLEYAHRVGAKSVLIVCNRTEEFETVADILIVLDVSPEVITGSTRMKSGTAQKMALNMISTTAMVLLGKCYGNLMVDLRATSDKLAARSRKILMELLEVNYDRADRLLHESKGSVKLAITMHRLQINRKEAETKLAESNGFLWKALGEKG